MSSLQALLAPRSIVVVGASADANRVNGRPIRNLLRDGYAGRIHLVNPKYREIAGLACHPDVDSVPEVPDLGVVAVAAAQAPAAVDALGRKGVKVVIVWSAGFAEIGEAGRALQEELSATARAHGIRLCGPNTLGLTNAFERMPLTFSQYADTPLSAGPVAFVSQSGAFGTAVATAARSRGIGLGYFVNTGNQADITVADVIDAVVDDERIRVVVAYLEGLPDGRAFVRAAAKARRLGKPIVVVKVGREAAGRRAAISHTGSLAGDDVVFDHVMRQIGVIRAHDETHALDLVSALVSCPRANGSGVGLVTISGGAGAMMADLAEEMGLEVPELAPATRAQLATVLRGFAALGNPVDVTGQVVEDASIVPRSLDALAADDQVHLCVVWIQLLHAQAQRLAGLLIEARQRLAKPFIVCWVNSEPAAVQRLREADVCVVETTRGAIQAAAGLVAHGRAMGRPASWADAAYVRAVAPPREPAADRAAASARAAPSAAAPPSPRTEPLDSMRAAALLQDAGLTLAPTRLARSADEAVRHARELGYPVALKIESPDLPHKTDVGGVKLGLRDDAEVRSAFDAVVDNARAHAPEARIVGALVQAMSAPQTELVLGLRRDPSFGPMVMVGMGGILLEVMKDVVFGMPPLQREDALEMIGRLRGAKVLDGVRGRPAVDRAAVADAVVAISRLALAHPDIVEVDVNPVFASGRDVIAVDWLVVGASHA